MGNDMKNSVKNISAFILCIVISLSFCVNAYAKTAVETVKVNQTLRYTYDYNNEDYYHYYRFTPSATGFYTAKIFTDNENVWNDSGSISLAVQDSNGKELDYSGWNDALLSASVTYEFEANKTYLFYIECWKEIIVDISFSLKPHSHSLYLSDDDKASINYDGYKLFECKECDYSKKVIIPHVSVIKLSKSKYVYNGKIHRPSVIVKDSKGKILKEDSDYRLKYDEPNSKNVWTYEVCVYLEGDYDDERYLEYSIIPKGTAITKTASKKKAVYLKWKKQTKQISGYQIQYSTDKKFKKNKKTVNIYNPKKTSYTLRKLKSNKKYYVRIRTFEDTYNLYSPWSKVKKVKTGG